MLEGRRRTLPNGLPAANLFSRPGPRCPFRTSALLAAAITGTAALLQERGVASVAPALPSCGEADRPGGSAGPGLAEDVAAVRAVLQQGDEPTVVVAHSYGGIVVA